MKMLHFRYDFLEVYCAKENFEYCEMDTDSAYMAIAGETLDDIVLPAKRQHYLESLVVRCNDQTFAAEDGYLPRDCCEKHRTFDKRTPGLFKLESEGDCMVSLCSKTYMLRKSDGDIKFSSKGLNKNALENPFITYKHVLNTGESASVINKGIKMQNNKVVTYQQERRGPSYLYCKRIVQSDGIHTKPLDITLCPWKSRPLEVMDCHHPWWLTTVKDWNLQGQHFSSLADVCKKSTSMTEPLEVVKQALYLLPRLDLSNDNKRRTDFGQRREVLDWGHLLDK